MDVSSVLSDWIILNNSETWIEIDDKTVVKLEDLQSNLLRVLLTTQAPTQQAVLTWDCGAIAMKYLIMEKKFICLHHIMNQNEVSLATCY